MNHPKAQVDALVGQRVTLTLLDIFGKPYESEGRITHACRHKGGTLPSGGWCSSKPAGDSEKAYSFGFVPKRKKKPRSFRLENVVGVAPW